MAREKSDRGRLDLYETWLNMSYCLDSQSATVKDLSGEISEIRKHMNRIKKQREGVAAKYKALTGQDPLPHRK